MRKQCSHTILCNRRQHTCHCFHCCGAFFISLQFLKKGHTHFISQGIGDNDNQLIFGVVYIAAEEIRLFRNLQRLPFGTEQVVPVGADLCQIFVGVDVFDQFFQLVEPCHIFELVQIVIEITVIAIHLVKLACVVLYHLIQVCRRSILRIGNDTPSILQHKVFVSVALAKMSLAALFGKLRNTGVAQLCSNIFQFQSFGNPFNQNLVNTCKDSTGYQDFHRELSELCFCFQAVIDHFRDFVKAVSRNIAVHQVVDKCDNITRFETDEGLPCSRHIRRNNLGCIGHEHSHREFFKGRLLICISEHILSLTPERIQKVIFLKLYQIWIIFKSCTAQAALSSAFSGIHLVGQNGAKNFFIGWSLALAENAHQCDLNGISVKGIKLQIVESLGSLLFSEELNVMLNHRLVAFINAQVKSQQGSSVCEELFRILDRIRQMVLTNGRLRKRSIHQIIRCGVYTLQKVFRIELVIHFQM